MTAEIRSLTLGGQDAAVVVREQAAAPEIDSVAPTIASFADELFATYKQGTAWPKNQFFGKGSSDIIQAIRLFCQQVNYSLSEAEQPTLNILELEDLIGRQTVSLALPLQNLCRWAVLVRVGVRKMQRDLLGLVAMIPLPGQGSVKLNRPTDNVGRTQYAVSHIFGDRFLCRGYVLRCDNEGQWILGGADGNRWFKDMCLTPGLQPIDNLVEGKRRKLSVSGKATKRERRATTQLCDAFKEKLEATRAAAGIDATRFSAAHGARLDLENKTIMTTALASIRAILAQAIVYQEDTLLDEIAGRCARAKSELLEDPAVAGREEAAVLRHYDRRQVAYRHFRPVGTFQMPKGYMVFAEQGVPPSIPIAARTELVGVSGVAVGADHLASRYDTTALRRNPAALPEIEDLTPLIDVCGVTTLNGRTIDGMQVLVKDADGQPASEGNEFMQYNIVGQPTTEMPLDEFLRKTSVRFVPMVVNFRRRRLTSEDLQGYRDGIAWALSFDDVSERFRPCPRKSDNSST